MLNRSEGYENLLSFLNMDKDWQSTLRSGTVVGN